MPISGASMTSTENRDGSDIDVPGFLTRRRFLRLMGWGLVGGAIASHLPTAWARKKKRRKLQRWSDPDTWRGRRVPRPGDIAVVRGKVLLDRNVRVAGVVVRPDSVLIFDRRKSRTLETTGNVVVYGKLVLRPKNPAIVHRLLFSDVNEARFVGGGESPLSSDVGLWVMEHGQLKLLGSSKLAWTRTTDGVAAGATSIELQEDPVGWMVGDEIVLTPTESPAIEGHSTRYDEATIAGISGRTIHLSRATGFPHPAVDMAPGIRLTAEVLNLSRNVRIEGSPGGRTHVFMHAMHPQTIQNAAIRYAGPRQPSPDGHTQAVLGRYGLHFHHCEDGSRGSLISGVVVRDCGAHAFVPHLSHGISFADCISHNSFEEPYWYDPRPDRATGAPPTNDVLYERCVASLVWTDSLDGGTRLSAYFLGVGSGNAVRNCVAVGVQGTKTAAGFNWPEINPGLWGFEDCVAHNNAVNGIRAWQNNGLPHVISRFRAYHNGEYGIEHGAYNNNVSYQDCALYGNLRAGVALFALSNFHAPIRLARAHLDGGGISDYAVVMTRHSTDGAPVELTECSFRGYTKAAFACTYNANQHADRATITDCTFEANEFWLESNIHPDSDIRVRDAVLGNISLRRRDQPGVLHPEWNASVNPIIP
jgi:hypothetical protein